MSSLYGSFGGYNGVKPKGLFLWGSLLYTDSKVIGSDVGMKLVLSRIKVLVAILEDVDVITLFMVV